MQLAPYRQVLALRGVWSLLAVSMLARIPVLAGSMVLTLYVVLQLKLGFGAAGTVFSVSILGSAIGAPVLGRLTDRYGLRPVVALGTVTSALFWATAGSMSFPVLLVAGFVSSLIQVPVFTVSRQALAALVPEAQRRPAYSLDSVAVELSYMTGPSLGVLVVTQLSPQVAIWAVGVGVTLTGIGLYWLNPPLISESEQATPAVARPPLRQWLRPGLLAVLLAVAGSTVVLGATDVVVVAVLREVGELGWASVVLPVWGLYSMTGGLVYGGLRRAPGPLPLMLLLGVTTIPLAFAGNWFWLCVALLPAGLMCAPTLAAAADAVSRMAPPVVRGEAMGYYGSSLNIGMAVGAPLAGVVIDLFGPSWGFAVAGAAGVAIALLAYALRARDRHRAVDERVPGAVPVGAEEQPVPVAGEAVAGGVAALAPAGQ
ncbi:MAG: MFS transporter [Micromonosporaceae bacterium]